MLWGVVKWSEVVWLVGGYVLMDGAGYIDRWEWRGGRVWFGIGDVVCQ